jgi:hypothetical protein
MIPPDNDLLLATSHFWAAGFGCFVLYLLSRLNDRQPLSLLRALSIELRKKPLLMFFDMIVSSAIGAGIVLILFRPGTASEAGAAGLGLTGILSALGRDAG